MFSTQNINLAKTVDTARMNVSFIMNGRNTMVNIFRGGGWIISSSNPNLSSKAILYFSMN